MRGRSRGGLSLIRIAFYWAIKVAAWPVTRLYVGLRVSGVENVPRRGRCIVVANHASYVDPVVLGSACPRRLRFMITRPIYRMLRLRWFYYLMGSIPVDPDNPDPRALRAVLRVLNDGGSIGIFPEGQRMVDGRLGAGKAGVSLLAARSGAPVVPVAILGARAVMPVGSGFPRPKRIEVRFGSPLRFSCAESRRPTRAELAGFAESIMSAIGELMAGCGDGPDRREDSLRTTGS